MTAKWYDSKPRMLRVRLPRGIDRKILEYQKACEELAFIGSQPKEDWKAIQENYEKKKEALRIAISKELYNGKPSSTK